MKDKIREIVDEFHNRPQFLNNCTVSLTLNYIRVIPEYEHLAFNEESYKRLIGILWDSDIKNYNITFRMNRGADDLPYDKDWKDVSFIFYGGESEEEPNKVVPDIKNYGLFAFNSLGASGDIRF